ncbi:density-regulated protein homolog [Patella vulgata]|uniref:density-regulated protein homolog n=1 Tax=Patella vulgata TaxID=6465 RepID=UPI00217FBD68|nr:density-regulated protein homolog [Patella vulgata]XP_050408559.1 density-regulated protein homolog [Patella vulgata]
MMAAAEEKGFLQYTGPRDDITYPVQVVYCGECTMPIEYCEYYPNYEKCKEWLERNLPNEFEKLTAGEAEGKDDSDDKKKRQTRGGKGMLKAKKKAEPKGIKMWTQSRGKKKKITTLVGLADYDIDLKVASKFFANKFSCGASANDIGEIVIQGDVKDDLFDILPEKWPQIDEECIDDLGEKK